MNQKEFSNTLIGQDYLKFESEGKCHPSIDELLDYMQDLIKDKGTDEFPVKWYEMEIEATKEIIKKLQ